jgi:hypothetical protein
MHYRFFYSSVILESCVNYTTEYGRGDKEMRREGDSEKWLSLPVTVSPCHLLVPSVSLWFQPSSDYGSMMILRPSRVCARA